jgi:RNA polymerase sigma factor (sigma-70 family)
MNTLSIDMQDNVIMQAAQEDPEQFAPIYNRYFDRIYSYCRRRVNNPQVAEDLCSQIFERVLKSRHTFRLDGNFQAWLFRIAHNVVYDYFQQQQQLVNIDTVQVPDESRPIEVREMAAVLNALIATLDGEERDILLLSVDGGLTSQEIGEIIGKKAGTVRVQLHRIIKRLREQYQEYIDHE